ncbi:MAG: nucleotidyltransferase family protein [Betaproteobacteria bacterium]|nr:nucleotidyltransferase family protein [Betaproteobacteria bacterium]
MAANICGILLAAGASKRFGSEKLLYPLGGGTPVAVAALANLRAAIPHVIAVVRPGVPILENRLSEAGATVILCANADEGMGASLSTAVAASGDVAGWVIALADMPYIRPETIAKIAASLAAGAAIVAPAYRGERGHPVGLSARFRAQLEALRGDEGARSVLRENADLVKVIEVDDPGVCRDIDTPDDLRQVQ